MAQLVRVLLEEPDYLSFLPRIHMVEVDNQVYQVVLCPQNVLSHVDTHTTIKLILYFYLKLNNTSEIYILSKHV